MKGFIRAAAVSLPVHLGDVNANETEILIAMENLRLQGVQLAVFPELCLSGATLGDLMRQPLVVEACWAALARIAEKCGPMAAVIGLPVRMGHKLLNCAAVVQNGQILGLVPKMMPGGPLRDDRHFAAGEGCLRPVMPPHGNCDQPPMG